MTNYMNEIRLAHVRNPWSNHMPGTDEARPSFTSWFEETRREHVGSEKAADVTIKRGAELIRADRDGRAPVTE